MHIYNIHTFVYNMDIHIICIYAQYIKIKCVIYMYINNIYMLCISSGNHIYIYDIMLYVIYIIYATYI